ncbi:dehydrogenase [Halobacteriales archaeon QS_4_69_34]|nr:MAG: dehydrogenase [Halobacteriales archaeon QS_4_69_34]
MVDAREYHDRTNHTPRSVREDGVRLDRATKPRPYKVYEDRPHVAPPGDPEAPETPALAAVACSRADPTADIDRRSEEPILHALCHYAAGVTKELEMGGRTMRFRAASCTGKLYHVDLYAVADDRGTLDAGVYHFDPHTDGFDVLREGDYRGVLADAAGGQAGVAAAPVTFVLTSEWWRNAWKYRERTYRHAFWDSGTIIANLLAVAHGGNRRTEVVTSFADGPVARLLGVAPDVEAPLELVPVGSEAPAPGARDVAAIDPETVPVSERVEEYPLVPDAWRGSSLPDGAAAREWREQAGTAGAVGTHSPGDGERVALDPVDAETASARPVGTTIERRGSLREFDHEPISGRTFATVLDRALHGVPTDVYGAADAPGDGVGRLVDAYCLVHAVEGIEQGTYQYHPGETALERVGDTDRGTAGHLALDQSVVGDAAANVYLMADVDAIVEELGDRGYRLAQLLGGIALGRLYLATYAHLGLGGRGFTFYDGLVTEHLSPRAANQAPMTLFAFGKADK